MKEDFIRMFMIHLLQTKLWGEAIMGQKVDLPGLKFSIKALIKLIDKILKLLRVDYNDIYDMSADVSESLEKIMYMDIEDIKEISNYIDEYTQKKLKKDD